MVQKRIHDYRGPRSSENLNDHLVGVVPPGVYEGFHVAADGSVSPGMLITPEGIRVEETEPISAPQPVADPVNPRIDLVVCVHEYEKTVPAPPALFTTVPGTPAAAPEPPDLPDHAVLLASCRMEAGAGEWTDIQQLGYPVRVYNAVLQPDHTWKIILGARGATLELFDPNAGVVAAFVAAPGTYEDGDTITWGAPVLEYSADGILQVLGVQANLDQETADRIAADLALEEALGNHVLASENAHPAGAIPIADAGNRFAGSNVEEALQEIAGAGRTDETVKDNADDIQAHIDDPVAAHTASAIRVTDPGNRYAAGEAEAALQEIAGEGRTTETVKVNADDIAALDAGKLDKAGGTVEGQLNLQGPVIFNAAEVENVKFDSYVEFVRWLMPCSPNSANWQNAGNSWMSPGGGPAQLYLPIPGIVGAELVSVDLGFANIGGSDATVSIQFQGQNIAGGIVMPTEFGSGGGTVPHGGNAVFNLLAVDPAPPHDPEPYAFGLQWWLMVEVETSDQWVLFSGAKCNLRRKRVAV